jgi:hypothetical protein
MTAKTYTIEVRIDLPHFGDALIVITPQPNGTAAVVLTGQVRRGERLRQHHLAWSGKKLLAGASALDKRDVELLQAAVSRAIEETEDAIKAGGNSR